MVKSGFPITMIRDIVSLPTMRTVLPSYYQVDGMIFAVASSPEIPMPEQWMPWLIQSSDGKLVDKDVDKLADGLMNGLRAHLDFMRQEKSPLPNELTMAEDTGDFSCRIKSRCARKPFISASASLSTSLSTSLLSPD